MSDFDIEFVEDGIEDGNVLEDQAGIIADEQELKKVVDDLCKKYREEKGWNDEKEATWAKWRRQFESLPESKRKDYPYPNASNVAVPLSLIVGQALFGHLKDMYDKVKPPWYVKPLREGDEHLVRQTETLNKYYNILSESRLDLNFDKFKRDFLQEVAVMGACFVKVPWTTKPWHFKSDAGGVMSETSALLHDGPELVTIPVEDLTYPGNHKDIQDMPWIAHDVVKAEHELLDLVTRGIYESDAVDIVLGYNSPVGDVRSQSEDDIMQRHIDRSGEFVLTEFYFFYDANKDGLHEDLVFTVHVPSGTVLRQSFNEFGYRMIAVGTFMNRTFALEGRGSGHTTEHMQDEINGIHNLRNDNMKFANMRVLVGRRGAFRENESIYPGKLFITDNPREDIMPLQLGEVYPSSLQAENMTMNYAREASGMSSIMSGFSDQRLGSRDTFRGQNLRMSQGQGLFSTIAEGLNECFSEIGMMIFFQMVKNRERLIGNEREAKRLTEEEIELLDEVLALPLSEVPIKLAFHIRTSDLDQTFEAKRQNMLSLTQLFSQYAQQVTPLAMQLFGPEGQQMKQVAPEAYEYLLSIYTGSTRLMSEVFKFFGEESPQKFVPDIRKYELLQEMLREMTGQMIAQQKQQPHEQQQQPEPAQDQEPVRGELLL